MESWMYRRIIVARRELVLNLEKYQRGVIRAVRKDLPYHALLERDAFCGELLKLAILEAFEYYYEE